MLSRRAKSSSNPPPPDLEPPDHRKIGVQQKLFMFSEYSPGSPILLPNGTRIYNRLVDFLRKQYIRYGFEEVITPIIYKKSLWKKSGHLENYSNHMYTVTGASPSRDDNPDATEDNEYGLKPMNCPGHCMIFQESKRRYDELPIRYADFSPLHRNELSGTLSGLTRVRAFHQDDGHIFCGPSQIQDEIKQTLDFVRLVYSTLKLGPYRFVLSTRPKDHFIGTIQEWDNAERALRLALDDFGEEAPRKEEISRAEAFKKSNEKCYTVNEGDGAFYGPKIDVILKDSDGKEHQTATIQLDFQLPKRFELKYTEPAPGYEYRNTPELYDDESFTTGLVTPILIHRAVLGSVERLMALLIEHHNGKWPFWLNPKQVIILTVNDTEPVLKKATNLKRLLMGINRSPGSLFVNSTGIVVDIDDATKPLSGKLRRAKLKGYSVIVTIGPNQIDSTTVTVDLSRLEGNKRANSNRRIKAKMEEMEPQQLLELLKYLSATYHMKQPLLQPTPSDPPPDYETAAQEHSPPLAIRQPAPTQPARRPPPPGALLDLPILKYMRTHRVVLASASPRRRALLAQLGLPGVEVRPSTKPEDLSKADLGPWAYVSATAQQKALDVYAALIEEAVSKQAAPTAADDPSRKDPDLVIAADTVIVTRDGAVLEKPSSEAAHVKMLRHLRDTRAHRVLTAVCCVAPRADAQHPGYAMASHVEETKVLFAREADGLPDDVIDAYVRTREGVDKAGGYAVQGLAGALLVEKVDGAVDNVVGLPMRKCLQLCEKVVFRQNDASDEEDEEDE
ncbi:hypothetical protein F4804DRAFT_346108 [Jackrogersella minutella]|nr:hypothetical protein F4804DRAFT_346108 [Jackrogersella minutella]